MMDERHRELLMQIATEQKSIAADVTEIKADVKALNGSIRTLQIEGAIRERRLKDHDEQFQKMANEICYLKKLTNKVRDNVLYILAILSAMGLSAYSLVK